MAKEALRVWKTAYTNKKDSVKAERRFDHKDKNRHHARQLVVSTYLQWYLIVTHSLYQACSRRLSARKLYLKKYPENPDPRPLLKPDYMTEENSDLADLPPAQRELLEQQVSRDEFRRQVKVLEVLVPVWRGSAVSTRRIPGHIKILTYLPDDDTLS